MDPVTVEAVGMDGRAGANINTFIRFLRKSNGRNQINAQEVESEGKDVLKNQKDRAPLNPATLVTCSWVHLRVSVSSSLKGRCCYLFLSTFVKFT